MSNPILSKSAVAAALLFAGVSLPVHAVTTTVADAYIGADNHGWGDVIGATSKFDTQGMDISVSGATLTVSIHTNFAGLGDNGLFASITGGKGIGYGDLFLSSAWTPFGTAADGYINDNASNGTTWTYAFSLGNRWMSENDVNNGVLGNGTLYQMNGVDNSDALLSQNFLTGGTFRNGQEVAVNTASSAVHIVDNNGGFWSVDAVNKTVNFTIDLTNTSLMGTDIAVHWAMTCANDTIEGVAPAVPVPAAVWLFGSGLLGLVAVARRRTV